MFLGIWHTYKRVKCEYCVCKHNIARIKTAYARRRGPRDVCQGLKNSVKKRRHVTQIDSLKVASVFTCRKTKRKIWNTSFIQ